MRKFIVYIAVSADGYIARPDGDVEWLNRRPRSIDYGIGAFYSSIDTILWGRKTYDMALGFEKKGVVPTAFDPKLKHYVFSRRPPKRPPAAVQFVRGAGAEIHRAAALRAGEERVGDGRGESDRFAAGRRRD